MNLKYENARWLIITLASLAFLALVIHLTCCTTKKRSLEYRLKSLHIETDTTKTHKVSTNDFEGHTNKTKPDTLNGKGISYPVLPIDITNMEYFHRLVLVLETPLIYNDSTGIIIDTTK